MGIAAFGQVSSAWGTGISSLSIDYPVGSFDSSSTAYVAFILIGRTSIGASGTAPTITATGWTEATGSSVTGEASGHDADWRLAVYYKTFDSSGGSMSFGFSAAGDAIGIIGIATDISVSSPVLVTKGDSNFSGAFTSTASTDSITPDYANSLILSFFGGSFGTTEGSYDITTADVVDSFLGYVVRDTTAVYAVLVAQQVLGAIAAVAHSVRSTDFSGNTLLAGTATIIVALNPFQGPSAPVLTQPDGGNQITTGTTYPIQWTASTHPTVAQSSLQYHIQYSDNAGQTWSDVVALTSAGVVTYNWSLSGRSPGTLYKVRIRAWDGTRFGPYDTSASNFTIIADQTPGAPVNVRFQQPSGTTVTVVFDRASAMRLAWTHNDIGDPQSGYEIRHSANADMSSATTITQSSDTDEFHDFTGGTFAQGIRYFDVRTKDTAGTYGPRSAAASILAGDKPATPNITAPTAASPPTIANPTVTWTSTGQVKYKIRVTLSGTEVFNTGFVVSTALTRPLGYNLTTGLSYVLLLSIRNADTLTSDEDSETFTPSFSGPATPTIDVSDTGEAMQIVISNSDTPDHVDLYKDNVRIVEGMGPDAVFLDRNVAHGVTYTYKARAFSVSGLFTESATDSDSVSLTTAWLHVITQTSVSANAVSGTIAQLNNIAPMGRTARRNIRYKRCGGRTAPLAVYGQMKAQRITVSVRLADSDTINIAAVRAAQEANADVCFRDQYGNIFFGRIVNMRESRNPTYTDFVIEIEETDFDEEV